VAHDDTKVYAPNPFDVADREEYLMSIDMVEVGFRRRAAALRGLD
jgi:hypothetical protein